MKRKRNKKANPVSAPSKGAILDHNTDAASEGQRKNHEEQPMHPVPNSNPQYNKSGLNSALMVIKKIMDMDGTAPFNVPVNPFAMGVTDYYDVISTPMDFGTVLRNLENGVKYKNSDDVFKDVRYIWENCYRYNKPGDRILEMVEQVKDNFMMLWTAAGLYTAESRMESGHATLLPSKDGGIELIRQSPRRRVGSIANSQQDRSHDSQAQASTKPQSCKRLNLAQPSSSHSHQLHRSSNKTQSFHSQAGAATNSSRRSTLPPSKDSSMELIRHSTRSPVGSMANSQQDRSHDSQDQVSTKSQSFKRLNLAQPSSSRSHHLHPSSNKTQSAHSQAGAATNSSRDTLSLSSRHTGKKSSRSSPRLREGPMTNSQQDQSGSVESHLRQPCQSSSSEHPNSGLPHQLQSSQPSSSEYQPSHPLPDPDSDCSDIGPSSRRKETPGQGSPVMKRKAQGRGRGPTLCLDVWNMPEGQQVAVETNEVGQPDGDSACKLGNFLGTIARDGNLAPLTYFDWRAVPQAAKDNMLLLVKLKFEITPRLENWVLKTLGKRWKDWKAQLKAKYFNEKTDEEDVEIDDERVLPHQRPILIAYWRSEESLKRAAMNKAIRAKQKIGHTAGTKSFARIRKEERNKRADGGEPTRAELFIVTHLHKDGTPVDETSANIITQLKERAQANTQPATEERDLREDIFSQVMGKDGHGRVRTYGLGPCPSDIWGPRPSRAEAIAIASEAKKALSEVSKMKEKMQAVESKCAEMEVQLAEMKSALQKSSV